MKLSTVRFVGAASSPQNLLQDLVAAHRLADALDEQPEQLDLVERERVLDAADLERVRGEAHLGLADLDHLRRRARTSDATEDGAHARDELVDAERLRHVVVGAGVEAADLVRLLRARRQHDDRHERRDATELLADGVAVHVGQHQIEDDGVGVLRAGELDAVLALARGDHAEALELEGIAEPHHDVGLVLDDQDGLLRACHQLAAEVQARGLRNARPA